ncbi:MAG: response regulator transcription factor [Betaproteobacteria bacterium]
MTRIVIADDHTMVREGLKQVLAAAGDLTVIAEAQNGAEVMQRVRELDFDVLLLDMSMPGKSGIELIKQVHSEKPKLRIFVLSMHEEEQYAVRALKAGAAGYLTKESASDLLVAAIRKVAAGGAYITSTVAEQFALGAMADTTGPRHAALSDREYQVFEMLVAGKSITDIAGRLNLSVKTVSTHKARIMQKMYMTNNAELVRYAINHNLVDDPDRSC